MYKIKKQKILSMLLVSGILLSVPAVNSEAAVITSNATDKTAVVFDENTAYSAGDYVTYDGEMFICTADIQGNWNTAKDSFMQITKNHELGNRDELSVSYDTSADPANEKSLMAFVANAWQKLKIFLGTENREAQADKDNYKNASMSAKLNFLEKQGEDLQESVDRSFQSVSSGKSLLANTITGKGVNVRQDARFSVLNDAILDMAQLQYDNGHTTGYSKGEQAGYSKGEQNGYKSGHEAGKQEGIKEGIEEADNRVNPDSMSYQQGLQDANVKIHSISTTLRYSTDISEEPCFSYTVGEYGVKNYKFHFNLADIGGHTIIGVRAYESSSTYYNGGSSSQMALRINGSYPVVVNRTNIGSKGDNIVVTDNSISWGTFSISSSDPDYTYTSLSIDILYM